MNEPGFSGYPVHHLDPGAQEFFPTAALPSVPQFFYPYPPPPPYDGGGYQQFPTPTAFVSSNQPAPVSLPPSSPSPSRALLLSMVPASVSESTVRRELEIFGDVRAVQMERRRDGLVTVHFYDVRDAQAALVAIQEQHMQQQFRLGRHYDAVYNNSMAVTSLPPPPLPPLAARGLIQGRVVWAQFVAPVTAGLPDGNNQGTIVIFNLDPSISAPHLREIFEAYGPVKELRDTPNKRNQRFVEFYDIRNAAKAVAGMNGKEIYGKTLVIEFSRPGGQCKKNVWRNNSQIGGNSINHQIRFPPPPIRPPPPPPPPRNHRPKLNPNNKPPSISNLSISDETRSNKKFFPNSTVSSGSSKHSNRSSRPWKGGASSGRHGKDHDPRFLIDEDAIMESNCKDSRTTVMIKNIPNKYSQKLLLNMLDNHCIHCNEQLSDGGAAAGDDSQPLSAYDFVYLPIDFINKCNVGYGFVNMTSPQATLRLYKAFHHQNWEVFNSRKICEVTYARLQGLEALREHFKNSKFPDDAEEYMPVVFTPPRDGRLLSDPVPIVGRGGGGDSSSAGSSKELSQVEGFNGEIEDASCDDDVE